MNIRELARLAGVSRSTVSRVLNGHDDVSPATRRKVLELADQLNFSPRIRRATGNVGVFVHRYDNEWFAQVLSGLLEVAFSLKWRPSLHPSDDLLSYPSLKSLCRALDLGGIVVIAPSSATPVIDMLEAEAVPHVIIQGSFPGRAVNWVDINNRDAAREAARHLLDLGHRRIGLLAPSFDAKWLSDRIEGYRTALRDAGIEPDPRLEVRVHETDRPLDDVLAWWLELGVTAILALEYQISFACYDWLVRSGIPVPDRVSLVGFGDYGRDAHLKTRITTVRQPSRELGRRGVYALKAIIDGQKTPVRETLKATLEIRDTTSPCATVGDGRVIGANR